MYVLRFPSRDADGRPTSWHSRCCEIEDYGIATRLARDYAHSVGVVVVVHHLDSRRDVARFDP